MIVTLMAVSVTVFAVATILPGDVASAVLGPEATPEALAAMRAKLGLDRPAYVQYLEWVGGVLHGDWGESLRLRMPVGPLLMQRFRNSLVLAGLAFIFVVPTAIFLGVIAGVTHGRWSDQVISVSTLVGRSLPEFVTGGLLIVIFASWLRWLPASSLIDSEASPFESFQHLILPLLTLMAMMVAHIARMMRSSMIEVMDSDYVRTAILKGLPMHSVILQHALRNALLPTITVIALNLGWLMGGLIIVESVFAYPGVGRLLVFAVGSRDIPLLQATVLLVAAVYTLSNMLADVLYVSLNPRIQYS